MTSGAIHAHRLFDGHAFQNNKTVVFENGVVTALEDGVRADAYQLGKNDILSAGFIDAQVNGGGGVMLNDDPSVDGLRHIANAHRARGTTNIMPTLITDTRHVMRSAIAAVDDAIETGHSAILGLHLEGPFLKTERKGIHRASYFLKPDTDDIALVGSLKKGRMLLTLAPECVPYTFIENLVAKNVIVSAGHSDATGAQMHSAFKAGLSGVTHLYNAMSQLQGRAPGVVGSTLASDICFASVIADGFHVDTLAIRAAFKSLGASRLFLVSDAMASLGSDQPSFNLFGVEIFARDGRLTDAAGTLAGAHLDMASAVRFMVRDVGIETSAALQMATSTPAAFLKLGDKYGHIAKGAFANFTALDQNLDVINSWVNGDAFTPLGAS